MQRSINKYNRKTLLGVLLLLAGLLVLVLTYYPVISAYISQYRSPTPSTSNVVLSTNDDNITEKIDNNTEKIFLDPYFGVYIPKIKANSKITKNVSPYDEEEYTNALRTGIAHAKGTSTPNLSGNVFLFAHSAVNFYERNKYDVYFYLLSELEQGDVIYVSYEGKIYKYVVFETKITTKDDTKYLRDYDTSDTLTIMACYPPGMNWKRFIVMAHRDSTEPVIIQ
ncbi:MAG TPA: sortase [Candidatus Dojkabacteria bacterium]|nr:sortase [Candidatus Dojkabacteria bacterium]